MTIGIFDMNTIMDDHKVLMVVPFLLKAQFCGGGMRFMVSAYVVPQKLKFSRVTTPWGMLTYFFYLIQ